MGNLIYILFACIAGPLLLMLGVVDKKARLPLAYLLVGLFLALFASELNGALANNIAVSYHTMITVAKLASGNITTWAMNEFIAQGMWESNDVWVPLTVATAQLDGPFTPAYLFVGGDIYSTYTNQFTKVYTYGWFAEDQTGTDAYVENIAVGQFNTN